VEASRFYTEGYGDHLPAGSAGDIVDVFFNSSTFYPESIGTAKNRYGIQKGSRPIIIIRNSGGSLKNNISKKILLITLK